MRTLGPYSDDSNNPQQMRALLATHDWTSTSLGEPGAWPVELRVALDLMLDAPHPTLVCWGGRYLMLYNDAYAALLGRAHPGALGRPLSEVMPTIWPDIEPLADAAMEGRPGHVEDLCVTLPPGGEARQRWFSASYVPLRGLDGTVGGFVHTAFETTGPVLQARRADQARQASEARLSAVFDSLPVGVAVTDIHGAVVLANDAMRRYLPTQQLPSLDERRSGRWTLLDAEGRPVARADFPGARALRGERVVPGVEALYREDGGPAIWAHISSVPIVDADGMINGQVSVVTDIDRVKRTEAALRESEEKYRKLFEEVDEAFCILEVTFDASGAPVDLVFLEVNPMFAIQSGISDARGRSVHELAPGLESVWLERYGAVARTGESVLFEEYSPKLGRWFEVNASRIGEPEARHVALVFRDTSERKRIEEDMRRLAREASEASRRKSEFLAVLAHELRNPMATIRTGLEIMRLRADCPDTMARVREMLERQTHQLSHLVDDLLDVARVSSGKIEIRKQLADLNRVMASAVETSTAVIQGARHRLEVILWPEPLLLDLDPTRIAQVVSNLLTNAAKYTPPGGDIRLEVRKDAGQATIAVSDTGVGILPEHQEAIFEMFGQVGDHGGLAQGGLGIGLSLVRQLATLHGGAVSVHSAGAGQGSTFTVRLPLGAQPGAGQGEGGQAPRQELRALPRRRFRVLVVDDNTDAAESLSLLLQMNAHEIRTATNGRDALALARDFTPDIAFLDIGMPGMTGYELAARLRALPGLARTTLVAVTGWGSEEDQARSREAGFDHHFTKPIAAETVSRLLGALG
ncbi:ATP-binding protein [Massilia oculi]|uniref:histidine kinase n=1 Tax=Massilia oculi TaxID=945844 RepID=A0A2S2DNY8_9BURK|nr:ATP-binding protein [Massilia oculi]AWL06789.1 hybrid sensor histidine kinase/response regulator [Massilia oculi]